MLFSNHNRKRVTIAWKIFAVLGIISMLLFTVSGLFY